MAVDIQNHNLPVERFVPFLRGQLARERQQGLEGVSLAALPPFLCAVKEMGVNITFSAVTKNEAVPITKRREQAPALH